MYFVVFEDVFNNTIQFIYFVKACFPRNHAVLGSLVRMYKRFKNKILLNLKITF